VHGPNYSRLRIATWFLSSLFSSLTGSAVSWRGHGPVTAGEVGFAVSPGQDAAASIEDWESDRAGEIRRKPAGKRSFEMASGLL